MDAPVALFALALSAGHQHALRVAAGMAAGIGQGRHPLRAGRTETAGSGARRLQRTLVVAEVALSIVPLACAGLMLRSFMNLMHSPLGFNPANVMTAGLPLDLQEIPANGAADGRFCGM